jgi:hypothetical protein
MPTERIPDLFEFPRVEHHAVVAEFNGGRITSDTGALLLGQTDRALNLTDRLADCFTDARSPMLVEHAAETLLLQRITGIALGYEDLCDHDTLRTVPCWRFSPTRLSTPQTTGDPRGCHRLATAIPPLATVARPLP